MFGKFFQIQWQGAGIYDRRVGSHCDRIHIFSVCNPIRKIALLIMLFNGQVCYLGRGNRPVRFII